MKLRRPAARRIAQCRRTPSPTQSSAPAALLAGLLLLAGNAAAQDKPDPDVPAPPVVKAPESSQNLATVPEDVNGLLDLDARIRKVVDQVLPAVVGLQVGNSQGSGVLISADGLILTAAHVSGRPGQAIQVIMPDGTHYDAVSMGLNREIDDGLVRIRDPKATNLPHVPLGKTDGLPPGTWTVALGHPGGYQQDRPPVVRVGRLLVNEPEVLITDNTLVGGDSGGPLFDLDGRLIGIHSRIGGGHPQQRPRPRRPLPRRLGQTCQLAGRGRSGTGLDPQVRPQGHRRHACGRERPRHAPVPAWSSWPPTARRTRRASRSTTASWP